MAYTYTYKFPNNYKARRRRIIGAVCFIVTLVLTVLISLAIALAVVNNEATSIFRVKFDTAGSPLLYFNKTDGLDIKWYHGANSQEKITDAIQGDYMMVEGDINLRWYGFPNQTNEPIMAHPPAVDSDLTLDQWIERIIATDNKGMKLDFKSDDAIEPSLKILAGKGSRVNHPVWINADIVRGPGSLGRPIDHEIFLEMVNDIYPDATLSLGWTTGCCRWNYTWEQMQEMWNITKEIPQPVTYPARAALLKDSWDQFRWLVNKDPDRFTITVWTPSGSDDWEGATEWDMLYCRNDINKTKIYYDLPGEKFDSFQNLSITAGTPLNYFPLAEMDGIHLTWAHGVNSQAELTEALNSEVMFLEADVLLQGQGTVNQTDIPIMAHPPDTESDITLEQWIDRVIGTDKGIKLDFKSIEALEPSLNILLDRRFQFMQPIFINADIFVGPGGSRSPVNATEFKRITNELFPWATLSVGWTTGWNNRPNDPVYDETMVTEMMSYVQDLNQPITFPIRAAMVKESWDVLKPLLTMSRGHTITIWSGSSDEVDPDDLVYIRDDSEVSKIFYDLPEDLMDEFLKRINQTDITSYYK